MVEIILFGGTIEGRTLCQLLDKENIETIVCVATKYGEELLTPSETMHVHMGSLNRKEIEELLVAKKPRLVIDATHPYATEISENISQVCEKLELRRLRLVRESLESENILTFTEMDSLVNYLNINPGIIFSTMGAKEAYLLSHISNYKERVWIRILPDTGGLTRCLELGFPPQHIICMQGPFSKAINIAMFKEVGADILLTKESGIAGGYLEKLEAAKECNMVSAVLTRPHNEMGITLKDMVRLIEEGAL